MKALQLQAEREDKTLQRTVSKPPRPDAPQELMRNQGRGSHKTEMVQLYPRTFVSSSLTRTGAESLAGAPEGSPDIVCCHASSFRELFWYGSAQRTFSIFFEQIVLHLFLIRLHKLAEREWIQLQSGFQTAKELTA